MGSRSVLITFIAAVAAGPVMAETCRDDTLWLRGDWGTARFNVSVADTPQSRAQGLMHVEKMPLGAGMLFAFEGEQPRSFWMKNTLIPLDMIFADAEGRVVSVHANAVPHDETPVPSGAPARYVLEVNGGLAARLGIVPGSEMQHPAIADAAWHCD